MSLGIYLASVGIVKLLQQAFTLKGPAGFIKYKSD